MDQNLVRPDLLPPTVPSSVIWTMAVVGVVLWFFIHRLIVRRNFKPYIRLGILCAAGFAASWAVFQLLGRYFYLAGPWHLLFTAALSAVSIEVVSMLYSRESALMSPRTGNIVVGCRLVSLVIVLFILLQPVLVGEKKRVIRRTVAVLVDDSASMHFIDKYWTLEERLEVAAGLGILKDSGLSLAGLAEEADSFRRQFAAFADLAEAGAGVLRNSDVASAASAASAAYAARAATMAEIASKLSEIDYFELKEGITRVGGFMTATVVPGFNRLAEQAANEQADLRPPLAPCIEASAQIAQVAHKYELAGCVVAFGALPEIDKQEVLAASDTTRAAIAARLLNEPGNRDRALIPRLRSVYNVEVFRFATGTVSENLVDGVYAPVYDDDGPRASSRADSTNVTSRTEAFRSTTDMTAAMETALREIPFEELAGILFVTDGRHNGGAGVDAVARRFGSEKIPVSSIVIGGTVTPIDLAFGEARAPDSVFLGDKVRIAGTIVATGAAQQQTKLRLLRDGELVDGAEYPIFIENDDFAQEFSFTDLPEEHGVIRYRLELDIIPNEEFLNNNAWELDVSVTDDRTNVLLVDNRPRWEFRYLRNLFYGRDKSVHLQEFLLRPDTVFGQSTDPLPPASASRKFGDSESGSFPVSRDEWRKFDVIIIGDLDDKQLTRDVIDNIKYCVSERGALLVVIAGPEAMPAKIDNRTWREMLPIEYSPNVLDQRRPPEDAFNFRLTPGGRGHQAMMLSSSQYENESIWNEFPTFDWRFPVNGVKPGAEVLAYAVPAGSDQISMATLAVRDLDSDPSLASRRIAEMRKTQAVNSLVVAHSYGQGKVLMLNTDRTWRLRYKIGDTHHHQFWGQVIRWGTGEKLRAGNQYVRIGTDKLRYAPTSEIRIFARIVDPNFNVIPNARPRVSVINEDDRVIKTATLDLRKDSNGFYETSIDAIADPGVYKIRLDSPRAKTELGADYPDDLETRFVVVTAEKPAEFVKITANRDMPLKLASITGGGVAGPSEIAKIWDGFGDGNRILHEPVEKFLWDKWYLFAAVILLLTTEWILRKKNGMP